jgi:DNA (cytosine-5)-methyltransferase 1
MEAAGYAFAPVVLPAAGFGAPHGRHRIYFVADANGARLEGRGGVRERADQRAVGARRLAGRLDDANGERRDRQHALLRAEEARWDTDDFPETSGASCISTAYPTNGFWRDTDWLLCRDGNWRAVEPGSFPLVDGAAARVGRLRAGEERLVSPLSRSSENRVGRIRGYGNAIVPQVAAEFIAAYLDALRDATG